MASPAPQLCPNSVSHCHADARRKSATLHRRNHCFSALYLSPSPSPSPSPSSTITIRNPHPHLHLHLRSINKRNRGPTFPNVIPRRSRRSFTLPSAKSGSDTSTSLQEEEEGNGERPAGLYDPDQEEDVANCQEILRVCTLFLYQRLFFFTHNVYAHKGILFIFIKVNSQS